MASRVAKAKMPTLAAGSHKDRRAGGGFTLLELLVVLAIMAFASAGVGFAMRDGTQARLEREALRLAALLESGRVRSQVAGVPVRWRVALDGFRFDGLPVSAQPEDDLPQSWLEPDTTARIDSRPALVVQSAVADQNALLLGPEPIIEPQAVTIFSRSEPDKHVRLATDGVRPFAVADGPP